MSSLSIVRSRNVVTPEGARGADIVIQGEVVTAVLEYGAGPAGAPVQDFGELAVLPGLVDSGVRVSGPGGKDWNSYFVATRAAAAGGVTTLADMPTSCGPLTTTQAALTEKRAAVAGRLHVDLGFHAGIVPGGAGELQALVGAGVLGCVASLMDPSPATLPRVGLQELAAAASLAGPAGLPLLAHAEVVLEPNPEILERHREAPRQYAAYLNSHPMRFETDAVRQLVDLARRSQCRIHVLHLSASSALAVLEEAHADGVTITAETCPHYLVLTSEQIHDGDTRFKTAPPIRGEANRNRLWNALMDEEVCMIVSDHSPCEVELKCLEAGDLVEAWAGIASLQLGLSVIWTEARRRAHTLEQVVEWMATRPAQLLGLEARKGSIAPGRHADLVVFAPDERIQVEEDILEDCLETTPYLGQALYGVVKHTFVRGQRIYDQRPGECGEFPLGAVGRTLWRGGGA